MARRTDEARFWAKVIGTDYTHCWLWSGSRFRSGYGAFGAGGKQHRAHRWAWTQMVGEIPDGLVLDHLCRTKTCVNIWHLEPVSQAENVHRGSRSGLYEAPSECSRGHKMTPANTLTFTRADGRTYRNCRTCRANYTRATAA